MIIIIQILAVQFVDMDVSPVDFVSKNYFGAEQNS